MSIIQEDEAKKFLDLYTFEIYCIDLLQGIKHIREGSCGADEAFTRSESLDSGQRMLKILPELLRELEMPKEEK